jgi:hypothetical protein
MASQRERRSAPVDDNKSNAIRQRLVELARAEEGRGEDPEYWLEAFGSVPPLGAYAWCGVFDLCLLRKCGLTNQLWLTGPKQYGFIYPCGLKPTNDPQPGDIAYFTRKQHHAIVLNATSDAVELCNGNGTGGVVSIGWTPRANVSSFFSIQSLIDTKISKMEEVRS